MGECLAVLKINPSFNYIADLPAFPYTEMIVEVRDLDGCFG